MSLLKFLFWVRPTYKVVLTKPRKWTIKPNVSYYDAINRKFISTRFASRDEAETFYKRIKEDYVNVVYDKGR